jgi:hypothetical protein
LATQPGSDACAALRSRALASATEISDLPKTISGKIRRSELSRTEKQHRGKPGRGALEFFEEDFP